MSSPQFQQLQAQFLSYIRRPAAENAPAGFPVDRLDIYSELLYQKFDESLSACFPVMHSILQDNGWRMLVQDFIAEHPCQTPYYRKIPDEFVLYLQQERQAVDDPPFLSELAHFEWLELALAMDAAEPVLVAPLTARQLLACVLVFNPVLNIVHYQWPVQQINRVYQPDTPPVTVTHILGCRDAEDNIRFISLSAATASLLLRLQNRQTALQALEEMGHGMTAAQRENLQQFALNMLLELNSQGAIIGAETFK